MVILAYMELRRKEACLGCGAELRCCTAKLEWLRIRANFYCNARIELGRTLVGTFSAVTEEPW